MLLHISIDNGIIRNVPKIDDPIWDLIQIGAAFLQQFRDILQQAVSLSDNIPFVKYIAASVDTSRPADIDMSVGQPYPPLECHAIIMCGA